MRTTEELLQEGLEAGQFGVGEPHGDHAMGFSRFPSAAVDGPSLFGEIVDLGSGCGLPGLVLAEAFPETTWSLVERRSGRAELLRRAIRRLGFQGRVRVLAEDARLVGWSECRATADWVTARSFGPPAQTAECAAPLLRPGGGLLVSEPLGGDVTTRWPPEGVAGCGLGFVEEWQTDHGRYLRFERNADDLSHLPRKGAAKTLLF